MNKQEQHAFVNSLGRKTEGKQRRRIQDGDSAKIYDLLSRSSLTEHCSEGILSTLIFELWPLLLKMLQLAPLELGGPRSTCFQSRPQPPLGFILFGLSNSTQMRNPSLLWCMFHRIRIYAPREFHCVLVFDRPAVSSGEEVMHKLAAMRMDAPTEQRDNNHL